MNWERTKEVQFPNIWHRFSGKIKIKGKPVEYVVKDVSDELIEPCIEHMARYYLVREAFTSHDGVSEDEVSLREIKQMWREKLNQRISLVAIAEGEGEESKRIAGVNIYGIVRKGDQKRQFEGKGMHKLYTISTALAEKGKLYEKYGVDHFQKGYGLSVPAHYQCDSVGYHILLARDHLCRACRIPLAVTSFSHPAGVHEALKAGYDTVEQIRIHDFLVDGECGYPRAPDRQYVLVAKAFTFS